jgi:hypothetical protein
MLINRASPNSHLHLTACGTLAADWCLGSQGAGDVWSYASKQSGNNIVYREAQWQSFRRLLTT